MNEGSLQICAGICYRVIEKQRITAQEFSNNSYMEYFNKLVHLEMPYTNLVLLWLSLLHPMMAWVVCKETGCLLADASFLQECLGWLCIFTSTWEKCKQLDQFCGLQDYEKPTSQQPAQVAELPWTQLTQASHPSQVLAMKMISLLSAVLPFGFMSVLFELPPLLLSIVFKFPFVDRF